MTRAEVDKANRDLSGKKQAGIEIEAHCDYLSAWEEDKYIIAQANVQLDEKGTIVTELVNARASRQLRAEASRTKSSTWTSARSSWSRWPPA